ncbi:MAG: histidine kinase [Bryobacteraceae bacterium]|nr:histidine kinase [Bryobacteraceae bacterium]MDW8378364.1 histidine kinase [Bryobacterales bacterium]
MRPDKQPQQEEGWAPAVAEPAKRLFWIAGGGFAVLVGLVLLAAVLGILASDRIQDTAQDLVRMHVMGPGTRNVEALIFRETQRLLVRMVWILGICLLLALVISVGTLTTLWRTFRRLAAQEDELAHVSWHLLDFQEKMARRFSHEMHDELGQGLLGLRRLLSQISEQSSPGQVAEIRRMGLAVTDEVIASVRRLSQMLRPIILDDLGLDAGLRWLCESFSQRTNIQTYYHSNFAGRLPEQEETHLFRIAQEALTNIARHAAATAAWVMLELKDGTLVLEISDNGRGLQQTGFQPHGSLGMIGMRARARQIGGELEMAERRDGGLIIRVTAPVQVLHESES